MMSHLVVRQATATDYITPWTCPIHLCLPWIENATELPCPPFTHTLLTCGSQYHTQLNSRGSADAACTHKGTTTRSPGCSTSGPLSPPADGGGDARRFLWWCGDSWNTWLVTSCVLLLLPAPGPAALLLGAPVLLLLLGPPPAPKAERALVEAAWWVRVPLGTLLLLRPWPVGLLLRGASPEWRPKAAGPDLWRWWWLEEGLR
jgi:hypothetical protein